MKPTEMIAKLTEYGDIETATALWAEANAMEKRYKEIKNMCRGIVKAYLLKTGDAKGKTATCSYGWTNPSPKLQLNEKAWENEVLDNPNVREIVQLFQHQEMRLKRAQEPFYEEVLPQPRVYIK